MRRPALKIRNLIAVLTALCAALPVPAMAALCVCGGSTEVHVPECCCEVGQEGICGMGDASPDLAAASAAPAIGAPETCTPQVDSAPSLADAEVVAAKAAATPPAIPRSTSPSTDTSNTGAAPSPPTASPPLFLLSCAMRC